MSDMCPCPLCIVTCVLSFAFTSYTLRAHKLTSGVVSDPLFAIKLAGRLSENGFVNVGYKAVDMVAGSANPERQMGECGARNMLSVLGFFQSVAKYVPLLPGNHKDIKPEGISQSLHHHNHMHLLSEHSAQNNLNSNI